MRFFKSFRAPQRTEPLDCEHDEDLIEALAGTLSEKGYRLSAARSWARYLIYGTSKRPCECSPRERILDRAKPGVCYRCGGGHIIDHATPGTPVTL